MRTNRDECSMGRISQYRALNRQDRRALWPAFWRLLLVRLGLIGGIRLALRLFGGGRGRTCPLAEGELLDWKHRAVALRRSARLLPGTHCLARALALRWWLRSCGHDARLHIGVAKAPHGVDSHAWVTVAGEPVDETRENIARFQLLRDEAHYLRSR